MILIIIAGPPSPSRTSKLARIVNNDGTLQLLSISDLVLASEQAQKRENSIDYYLDLIVEEIDRKARAVFLVGLPRGLDHFELFIPMLKENEVVASKIFVLDKNGEYHSEWKSGLESFEYLKCLDIEEGAQFILEN